jgi:hypothetical protein
MNRETFCIFGTLKVGDNAVHTHNDTYMLSNVTAISARRPFLGASILVAGLMTAFSLSFSDLLLASEMTIAMSGVAVCLFLGFWLGHLQLLSRDLRGSELGTAIWGSYRILNGKRREVADAILRMGKGELS